MQPLPRCCRRAWTTSAQQQRTLFSLRKKTPPKPTEELLLSPDDLLHPMSASPIPAIRDKARRIKHMSKSPLTRESVEFDCLYSGWPTHHTEQEWHADRTDHARYWPALKTANEDEHDLRSGRRIVEYEGWPGQQPYEETVSMANWDVFFYTRGFRSVDSERSKRHISKLLTFPITIGTVLHENSPYNTRNQRLTNEGMRSLLALRQSLHPPLGGADRPSLLTSPLQPLRIFCLGARAESSLPTGAWSQLSHLFPNVPLHVYLIGPEASLNVSGSKLRPTEQYGVPAITNIANPSLTLTTLQAPYEEVHDMLGPFDPYKDVFFAFSPGFGFDTPPTQEEARAIEQAAELQVGRPPAVPQSQTYWHDALVKVLDTKCALFCTGFSPADVERDVLALDRTTDVQGEFEWVLTPGENPFASERVEVAEFDYRVLAQANWGIWAIKGKRYELKESEREEEGLVSV